MAMTLDQLRTFQAVAAVKSFRGAAEVLHITQPAISKQIQALEAELNERLFERGKSARLTSAGTALLKHAEHLSRILAVAKEEITDLRELRAGHLSIGAAHSVATYVLPGLIEAYRARYPKVKLSVNSAWSGEITGRVMTHDLDLGLIRLLSPKPQGFQQVTLVPFATNDLVFVASPKDRLAGKIKSDLGRPSRGALDLEPQWLCIPEPHRESTQGARSSLENCSGSHGVGTTEEADRARLGCLRVAKKPGDRRPPARKP
jgi:DNA-binding transcriptional LysR family regulator